MGSWLAGKKGFGEAVSSHYAFLSHVLIFNLDIWKEEVTKFLGAISTYSGEKIVSGN